MSGFVFKVQANMDPSHRDRIAFMRVCSGRFERGMVLTHGRTEKPFATKYAHQVFGQERETIEEAYPGDVVGLVNATDVRVGDSLYEVDRVIFPRIPTFAPEHFSIARVLDTAKVKQFRKGITQLDEEGVVQVLRDPDLGDQAPVLAAVGPMQFEVADLPARDGVRRPGRAQPDRLPDRTPHRRGIPGAAAGHARGRCARTDGWDPARAVREHILVRTAPDRGARPHAREARGRR